MNDMFEERAAAGGVPAPAGVRQSVMRCPRLGGEVALAYCEREAGELPCPRIILCWQGRFPVAAWLQQRLSPADWERFGRQEPKDRLTSLLELIEKAKQRRGTPAD